MSADDGKAIRILRISFDLDVALLNQRGTQFERDLKTATEQRLRARLGARGITL